MKEYLDRFLEHERAKVEQDDGGGSVSFVGRGGAGLENASPAQISKITHRYREETPFSSTDKTSPDFSRYAPPLLTKPTKPAEPARQCSDCGAVDEVVYLVVEGAGMLCAPCWRGDR